MAASQDTYTMASMYASGAVPTATFIYPNDRYLPADAKGFTKYTFTVSVASGTVTGPSISFYFTNSERTASGLESFGGTGSWTLMTAPAEQTGGGSVLNPITASDGTIYMQFMAPCLAYRVVTNAFSGGGSVNIHVLAVN